LLRRNILIHSRLWPETGFEKTNPILGGGGGPRFVAAEFFMEDEDATERVPPEKKTTEKTNPILLARRLRHSREGGNPAKRSKAWIPAFAGMMTTT
jgi:hypothetical protein